MDKLSVEELKLPDYVSLSSSIVRLQHKFLLSFEHGLDIMIPLKTPPWDFQKISRALPSL